MDPSLGGGSRPYLTDFGLAKSLSTGSKLTKSGQALGTPTYMSPEQARGEVSSLTPATDAWSLGCVLHEMLAGRPPFDGDSPGAIIGKVLLGGAPPIRRLAGDVPAGVERIIHVCLAKAVRERYRDAGALRDDLERVRRGERPRAARPGRRRSWAGAAVGIAAALGAGLAVARRTPDDAAVERAAVERLPSPAEPLQTKARALRHSDPREAARLLGEALEAEPGRQDWRLERGLLLWASERGPEARAEWTAIPPTEPQAALATLYVGLEAFFRLEAGFLRGDEAEPALRAAAQSGDPFVATLAQGALLAHRRNWSEARGMLRGQPGWEAAYLRGFVETSDADGDRAAAAQEFDRGLSDGIPFAWALCTRGALRRGLGNVAGAIEDFDAALRLCPSVPHILVNRGNARRAGGQIGAALEDYDAALALPPTLPEAYFNRGIALRMLGDARGAIADYDTVLKLRPDYADALVSRGAARQDLQDDRGALEDFTTALRLRPDFLEALSNRGNARRVLGDFAGAIEDCDAALRLRPDCVDALVNRCAARHAVGDDEGAIADGEAARRLQPERPEAHANLGLAYHSRRDFRRAIESYLEFVRLAPGHARVEEYRRAIAACQERLKDLRGDGR
ncbi:MAG: tetratricopeptide repeat-containing serine/threonine-protein kinase [Planctomycetales bacterium]|nr:tetratricopeptide repeat-containing serine/threonine-protein kinase [Planctomycetales bacterium]